MFGHAAVRMDGEKSEMFGHAAVRTVG